MSAQTPVSGTMSSSRQTATSCRLKFFFLRPGRPDLAALGDEDHVAVGRVAVHEVAEALEDLRRLERLLPLALVALDVPLHVGLELGADAERILATPLAQVMDAAFQVLEPDAGALQPVAGADVEHEEAVDVLDQAPVIQLGREQLGVPRLHAAVAADVEVPALLGGDDADVLALRLGAFARAAGHRHLDLVRRAQAAVAVLDVDRHRHRVLHAVAAPGVADAGLHRAQRLAIRMARLEARRDELLPDERQLLDARAEEVDALRAGDLRIEAVALRHFAEHDQLVGRDLAAGNARHDRISAVLLQVGEEMIVGVLQRRMPGLEDHLVPAGGEDRRDRRLADVAAFALAVPRDQLIEGADAIHLHQVEELLARVREVLAEVVGDRDALLLELQVDERLGERPAAAAAGRALGGFLQRAERRAAGLHGIADLSLRDAVAGADQRRVRQRVDADTLGTSR